MVEVNLAKATKGGSINNLSGKDRGIAVRRFLKIDEYDSSKEVVHVRVPDDMDVITPSFFQGLFSQSIVKLGGKDGFVNQYKFHANAELMKWINRGIDRSLMKRTALD
ncbi:hypothetical protein WH95_02970 [Kiloniella litopenaei]|uniref:DUF4325 domain-containing protein n=1 Tax=Kiloniella litopenaei TaxID=1549748 RepID=A0A0M2R8X8_9PROT|nr:hypothetical protein [Kiloniella litopenaei]KKJ78287.1 hypothetical protein WH95_02970 [Kiloniella litopenaei]